MYERLSPCTSNKSVIMKWSVFPKMHLLMVMLVVVLAVFLAYFVCMSQAARSGWDDLGRLFSSNEWSAKTYRFVTIYLNEVQYPTTIGIEVRGMHISAMAPMVFFGHPAIFIPWKDITGEIRHGKVFTMFELRIRRCGKMIVAVPFWRKTLSRALQEVVGERMADQG